MKKLIVFSVFFGLSAMASVTITRVNEAAQEITVSSKTTIAGEVGDFLEVGDKCPLEIISSQGKLARLSYQSCETPELLKVGTVVNNPFVKQTATTAPANIPPAAEARLETKVTPEVTRTNVDSVGVRLEYRTSGFSGSEEVFGRGAAQFRGFALGFVDIQQNKYSSMFHFIYSQAQDSALQMMRAEYNLTYGFRHQFYGFGGFNLSKFTTELTELEVRPGLQLGLGVQFTKNYGLQFSYNNMNFDSPYTGGASFGGIEAAVHATF
jgi:hypothetical protein